MTAWRLLDTGPRSAAENMALDAVILDAVADGESPPTLRFMQFRPGAVLVGAFQRVEDEVRLGFCHDAGIDVNRRHTGGGAIFFDEAQIGWEVVCRWGDAGDSRPGTDLFERLCTPVVMALRDLGIEASYRPRNDIEVEGRKISGTGGTDLRGALLFQGTLLVDFDVETMVRALRVPVEKLRRREIEGLRDRVTWVDRELGAPVPLGDLKARIAGRFEDLAGGRLISGELTVAERTAFKSALPRFTSDAWIAGRGRRPTEQVRALYASPGGMLRPVIKCDRRRSRIEALVLDGDFFAYPRRGILDLEARLKGARVSEMDGIVREHMDGGSLTMPGIEAEHVIAAIREALGRHDVESMGMSPRQANATFVVGGSFRHVARLGPTHLLLPYCAKPLDCDNRGRDGCDECGSCGVGEGYALGARAGLEVHTVTSYEHLMDVLSHIRTAGAPAYIGSCCEAFYVKHRQDLEAVGLPGILVDVAGNETCYDLGKSGYAYRGEYEGSSEMDVGLLRAVLAACRGVA
ncbi:MAG: lipoate--protein ligase family protein [Deltaproteobacteria bacterium]|nr:lipoate--protein ligase family protein [Deltaproteobacteria bacterium]